MKPRLKEDPREWQKFMLTLVVVLSVLTWWGGRWSGGASPISGYGLVALGLVAIVSAFKPRWFRGLYRGAMTASHAVGQVMGRVLLTVVFIVLIIPLGCLLRWLGKDLLRMKKDSAARTYWQTARPPGPLDRLF
ncbi:MAG TPA: SxtJ family membrane protein [Candidatus Paceibacterota bacterium]|nr:SxtJ family membrane protein [Verrucomicrobiota bacterium]HRY48002.1 SxtJ family membrane protein [Candidatus Paceibacterota bacterium]HRZ99298.1 SxtJ family membrane protein [Candidatus Paceibacterota bacterium]